MNFYELNEKIINERLSGEKYVGRLEMGRKKKRKPGNRPGGPRSASMVAIDRSHLKYSRKKDQFDYQADVNEDHAEMSDDDYKITPSGHLGGKVSVRWPGAVKEFQDVEGALDFIRKDMEENHFWPNIWWISDHGNHWMIDLEGNEIKENADDVFVSKQMSAKPFSKRKRLTPEQLVTQATDRWAQKKRVAQAQSVKKENTMDFHELDKKMNNEATRSWSQPRARKSTERGKKPASRRSLSGMKEELQKRLIRLQDEQREAEDAGNMEKADRLHRQIERLYDNMNRPGVDASGPGWH
jgi:hypothetical protein